MRIEICSDFEQDFRKSMDEYSDRLSENMSALSRKYTINQFRPQLPGIFGSEKPGIWKMRWARYVSYPYQIQRRNADLFHIVDHGYAHLLRHLGDVKSIVTVHDIIPLLLWKRQIPTFNSKVRKPSLAIYSLKSLKLANRIIVNSKTTRQDLLKNFDLDENKVITIPIGIDKRFSPVDRDTVENFINRLGWRNDPKVQRILISGAAHYKNWITSLKAFKECLNRSAHPENMYLIKSGARSAEFEKTVSEIGLSANVQSVQVSDEDMPKLYSSVDCLCFPSHYEGFGLPPLEAISCGTPIVVSNTPALAETTGSFALAHEPDDYIGISKSIQTLLKDQTVRRHQVALGQQWVSNHYTWEIISQKTLQVYDSVIEENTS